MTVAQNNSSVVTYILLATDPLLLRSAAQAPLGYSAVGVLHEVAVCRLNLCRRFQA